MVQYLRLKCIANRHEIDRQQVMIHWAGQPRIYLKRDLCPSASAPAETVVMRQLTCSICGHKEFEHQNPDAPDRDTLDTCTPPTAAEHPQLVQKPAP